ncbi:MAG: O-methyltransferase [Bacilli bacterium]|nr:O-methyltransferase [Bacilli bacterium]MDD4808743.1 O-methyltransferase [Bacilli bacterium]
MLENIEDYARINKIPIMEKDGIEFLIKCIKDNKISTILEIGSAIGYSAIQMALVNSNVLVTTIERDTDRYNEAVKNIKYFKLNDQIEIINDDAFKVLIDQKYDLIFIDAAKGQYIKFFEKFKNNLNENGVIISDNLHFHGLVNSKEKIESRNVRGLVRKLRNYIDFLKNNEEFDTEFVDIGDGISISRKK